MQKIHQLDEHIIAQIAAGEVIERPVFAVKELIENAIDAHADTITLSIEESGLKKITIIDNGEGMSEEDILLCFKPHTTSKISEESDLGKIQTLGFRGEALASIAAIADVTIASKTHEQQAGISVFLKAGTLMEQTPIGLPFGTKITIERLFYPVPGRKKFLKSQKTEYRHILDLLMRYAVSYPTIRFTFSHNNKIIFDLPKTTREKRLEKLFGKSLFENFLPVTFTDAYITIQGFIAKPQITTAQQNKQFLFINYRLVTDKMVALACKEAFGTLLDATHHPIFVLFLSLPFETVDVNVHPRKEQVSFTDNRMIFDFVQKAVSQTLTDNNLTFQTLPWKIKNTLKPGLTDSLAAKLVKETSTPWLMPSYKILKKQQIMQIHRTYLLIETDHGLLIVDQHAAHERILFEQFKKAFLQKRKKSKKYLLQEPLVLDISLLDKTALQEQKDFFDTLGFSFVVKSEKVILTAIPTLFKDRDISFLLQEMLANNAMDKNAHSIDTKSQKMLSYLACRAAIKAGDVVTTIQAKELCEKLEQTENNATCPHARPTKQFIDLHTLHRMFKRE